MVTFTWKYVVPQMGPIWGIFFRQISTLQVIEVFIAIAMTTSTISGNNHNNISHFLPWCPLHTCFLSSKKIKKREHESLSNISGSIVPKKAQKIFKKGTQPRWGIVTLSTFVSVTVKPITFILKSCKCASYFMKMKHQLAQRKTNCMFAHTPAPPNCHWTRRTKEAASRGQNVSTA